MWLILSSTSFTEGGSRVFLTLNPDEGYRSVTPLDATGVNRTIFHDHAVPYNYHATSTTTVNATRC